MGDVRDGFLLIADVTGYTSFLTGTELEHAQEIMEGLTRRILDHVQPPLKLVKLEGDAVFAWAPGEAVPDGERILELVESCYFDFADHLDDARRNTTCTCSACSAIPTLDLKFFAHYGKFVVQRLAGTSEDLAGPDVILIHRLLKNRIAEERRLRAYAFFTEACLARIGKPLELPRHSERYEHLGEVAGGVHDLRAALAAMREARRAYVAPGEGDFEYEHEFAGTAAELWDWHINPLKRVQWNSAVKEVRDVPNERGRMGAGAAQHCGHGSFQTRERLLDARPFRYYTVSSHREPPSWKPPPPLELTLEFTGAGDGRTRVTYRMRALRRGLWRTILRLMRGPIRKQFRQDSERLESLLGQARAG